MKTRLVWKWVFVAALLALSGAPRAEPFAYFVDQADGSVTPIDVATNKVLASIVVGAKPVSVAAPPVGPFAYVGNLGVPGTCIVPAPGGGGGGIIPPASAPYISIVDSSSLKVVAKVNVPLRPELLQASSDSTRLYIVGTDPADPCSTAYFFGIFDTAARRLAKRVALPGVIAASMAVDNSHSRVYLRNGTQLYVIDASSGGILASIGMGSSPFADGLAIDEVNHRLYAAKDQSVIAMDTTSRAILWQVATAATPASIALHPSGSPLLVAEAGSGVEAIDVPTRSIVKSIPFSAPRSVAVSPDGKAAYVVQSIMPTYTATPIRMAGLSTGASRSIGATVTDGQFIGNLSDPPNFTPDALTGLWWNPAESGWGMHLTQHAGTIFAVWFTYDENGKPAWYVAPKCAAEVVPASAPKASCTSDLFEVHAPPFFRSPFNPRLQYRDLVGSLRLRFQDEDHAAYDATVNAHSVSGSIEREIFRTGPVAGTSYSDLWYNPTEPGWGLGIAHQGDTMFLAWFVYDDAGDPEWLVAPDCAVKAQGDGCSGALYSTSGPLGPGAGVPFDPSKVAVDARGEVDLTFDAPDAGVLRYTVDGRSDAKAIIRQGF